MLAIAVTALLPRGEDPIPETIGVGLIFSTTGAGGVIGLIAGSWIGLTEGELDAWTRHGVSLGFVVGVLVYIVALIGEIP
jgi:hypothetical protein